VRRVLFALGAVACLALAAAAFALASDAGRWRASFRTDDVRYRTSPEAERMWSPSQTLPGGITRRLLGISDDVRFREALRAFRLSHLELGITSDPKLALQRGEARARLQEIAGSSGDPKIRARAMGLVGVLSLAAAFSAPRDQLLYIQDATAALRGAIALDPSYSEPKANLELSLQRGRALQPSESAGGQNPSPGGAGAKGAGAGDAGTGY
jgi:hypothetical protein